MSIKYDEVKVKRPLQEISYEPWQIEELLKCKEDIFHFLKYVKIVHPDKGRVTFKPYDYQKELLNIITNERFVISLQSRQSGKSTVIGTYVIWYAIFHSDKVIGIVSNKEKSAKMILSRIKKSYEELPPFLKPGVKSYNELSIVFDNDSKIIVSATSPDALRGETLNCISGRSKICICNDFDQIFYIDIEKVNLSNINSFKEEDMFIMSKEIKNKKYYTVYKTTNKVEGKIYIGLHSTNDLEDGYLGSGKILKKAVEKYGIENFEKEYLGVFDNQKDAEDLEMELVNRRFVEENSNYNISVGGNVCILYGRNSRRMEEGVCSKMQILTKDGFKSFDQVKKTKKSKDNLEICLSTNKSLICTKDHKILTKENMFLPAKSLQIGDVLFNDIEILDIKDFKEEIDVYDVINVEDTNSFMTNGIEVHNCLCMDEFSFVPKGQANDFYAANYPTISASKEGKIIIISTPNGMYGLFHKIYSEAEMGKNMFKHLKVSWERVPGRDEKWKEEQLKNMTKVQFDQEFAVKFIGSINTVVDSEILERLLIESKEPTLIDLNNRFRIYEKPIEKCNYCLGVDSGKGSGEHNSTIQVLKINSTKPVDMEQVAVFEDNNTDIYQFSAYIHRIAIYYNNAYIMAENNAEGSTVVNQLWWEYEYPNLVNTGTKAVNLGIRATKKTKPEAVLLMKKLIEDGNLKIIDKNTIDELLDFVEGTNGKFHGKNSTDDLVSALYWAVYILKMNVYDDFEFKKINKEEEADVWGLLADINENDVDWEFDDIFAIS